MEPASRAMASQDRAHALATYAIRPGTALLAFALSLALPLGGLWLFTTPAQPSMSAYYHAHPNLSDTLVGVLVAMGFFLSAGFRAHCALRFSKGNAVVGRGPAEAMGSFGRIRSASDLPSDAALRAYVKNAVALVDAKG